MVESIKPFKPLPHMMLSDWHKKRASDNAKITKTVVSLEDRQKAVGSIDDFPNDAMTMFLSQNAEQIFEPKKITYCGDWLASQSESHQYYSQYKNAKKVVNWFHLNKEKNKVYLMLMDRTFSKEDI